MTRVINAFDTNVIIERCPFPEFYASEDIIASLREHVDRFDSPVVGELRGKTKCSLGTGQRDKQNQLVPGKGMIYHLEYLQPLMNWMKETVWKNRHYLRNGKDAQGIDLGRNWINEMYQHSTATGHSHRVPVAVFYVRVPPNGADMIFVDKPDNMHDQEVAAGVKEGDLLIHEAGLHHSVSAHRNKISRICLVVEFKFY